MPNAVGILGRKGQSNQSPPVQTFIFIPPSFLVLRLLESRVCIQKITYKAMKKKPSSTTDLLAVISILVISSSCFPAPAQCRNQAQKLNKLLQAKMRNEVDTAPFKAVAYEKIASRLVDLPPGGGSKKEDDLIGRLPGQPAVTFKQYGGYVNVDPVNGRNMYYYFVEAQHPNKDELPLVLWLNGGPGCSSLAYGAMTELGPFRVGTDAKTLYVNKYSWNKVANVLFVESPAGVGFSYSKTPTDYTTGDINTAEDNFVFMQNWLKKFPEYKGRDFYITGESYAGHYVPQLAHNILMHMLLNILDKSINLKGIMVGNAVLNDETDSKGMYDYFRTHGMASPKAAATVEKYCDFSPEFNGNQTAVCKAAYQEVQVSIAPIFPYNIYVEDCLTYKGPTQKPLPFSIIEYDECSPEYVEEYLNREEVQKAMHANTTNLPYRWTGCTDNINYNQASTTVMTDIQFLLANNISVWIYSGDLDAMVPLTSTQLAIKIMNVTVETKFHPWFIGGQVGGYTETYKEGFTFATVRGAGHEVPSYQPLRALSLFMHFIGGTPLPNSKKFEA